MPNLDDPKDFLSFSETVWQEDTLNFVVEFNDNTAECSFDLAEEDIKLLTQRNADQV